MKDHPINYRPFIELITFLFFFSFLVYQFRSLLLYKGSTFTHDHFYWGYPIFQYYVESLINGHFPMWNPFSHGGEPFYPILLQIRLLEPIVLLTIFLMKWITRDLILMYNWAHFNQIIVLITGVYFLLRPVASNLFTRLSLIPLLLFFSFMFSSFRQPAVVHQFLWTPYLFILLSRIIFKKDNRWHNWVFFGCLVGVNWQSYFFSGVWLFLLFFFLSLILYDRNKLKALFRNRDLWIKCFTSLIIIVAMMLPNISMLMEKEQYVFPARELPADFESRDPMGGPMQYEVDSLPKSGRILMPYRTIEFTGTSASVWDFIKIIVPEGNGLISSRGIYPVFGTSSEAYLYIGMLPWLLAVIGLVCGTHEQKKIWLFMTIGFGLLLLGPSGGLHRILYYIFPPLWFVRHTHSFILFFTLSAVYFYVLGLNHIFSVWETTHKGCFNFSNTYQCEKTAKSGQTNITIQDIIPFLVFFIGYVGSIYCITLLRYPLTNYQFLIIFAVFVLWHYFGPVVGKKGLAVVVGAGHIILAGFIQWEHFVKTTPFILKTFLLIVIPVILFFFFLKRRNGSRRYKHQGYLLMLVFVLSLGGDILHHLQTTKDLYQSLPHPEKKHLFQTSAQETRLPEHRKALLPQSPIGLPVRYMSVVLREAHAFSPVSHLEKKKASAPEPMMDSFERALLSRRWSSFLLTRTYFNLIHMRIPFKALKEMFAVEKPIIQIKDRGLLISENDLLDIFSRIEADEIAPFLERFVFITPPLKEPKESFPDSHTLSTGRSFFEASSAMTVPNYWQQERDFSYDIRDYRINSLELSVQTNSEGILYWSDGYDKHWRAYLNGKQVPVFRANINFKAVVLPKGETSIRFVYEHIPFLIAVFVFEGIFFVCFLVGTLLGLVEAKKWQLRRATD